MIRVKSDTTSTKNGITPNISIEIKMEDKTIAVAEITTLTLLVKTIAHSNIRNFSHFISSLLRIVIAWSHESDRDHAAGRVCSDVGVADLSSKPNACGDALGGLSSFSN